MLGYLWPYPQVIPVYVLHKTCLTKSSTAKTSLAGVLTALTEILEETFNNDNHSDGEIT